MSQPVQTAGRALSGDGKFRRQAARIRPCARRPPGLHPRDADRLVVDDGNAAGQRAGSGDRGGSDRTDRRRRSRSPSRAPKPRRRSPCCRNRSRRNPSRRNPNRRSPAAESRRRRRRPKCIRTQIDQERVAALAAEKAEQEKKEQEEKHRQRAGAARGTAAQGRGAQEAARRHPQAARGRRKGVETREAETGAAARIASAPTARRPRSSACRQMVEHEAEQAQTGAGGQDNDLAARYAAAIQSAVTNNWNRPDSASRWAALHDRTSRRFRAGM